MRRFLAHPRSRSTATAPPRSSAGPRRWASDRPVRPLTYLGTLALCLAAAAWVEPVLHVGVLRRWRRLVAVVLPVAAAFLAWDAAAIAAGEWSYDPSQLI